MNLKSIGVLAFASCASVAAAQRPATTAAISVRDIRSHLEALASDSMEGRNTGRRGGLRSALYLEGELRRLGLEPAGDGGTYLQAVPWVVRAPDSSAVLSAANAVLRWKSDYVVIPRLFFAPSLGGVPYGDEFNGTEVSVVFGGTIGGEMISPDSVAGKVVLFAPEVNARSFFFWQRDDLKRYFGAAAIVVANLDQGAPPGYLIPREAFWDPTGPTFQKVTLLSVTREAAGRILGAPIETLRLGSRGAPLSGRAGFIERPAEAPSYNVVGVLRGSNPALKHTYVAVTAHHDHVGIGPAVDHDSLRAFNTVVRPRGADDPPPQNITAEQWDRIRHLLDSVRSTRPARRDSIFNGADDDASGTVLGLEIAEALVKARAKPARSVLFVFHTAEEKGLFGAQYFTDHPTVPRDSIIAAINMDQMGRGDPIDNPSGGPNSLVVIGARRLSPELGDLVERVNSTRPHGFRLDYSFDRDGDPLNAYCRSDHYMYARYGIPVAFFAAAAWYIDYHMVSDEPQYIAYERMARIGRYIHDVTRAVADLPTRPRVEGARPDPRGGCAQ